MVDSYIADKSLDAPSESLPHLDDGYRAEEMTEVSLRAAGITTIIWAMGYAADYRFVKLPIFDDDGYPRQDRGVILHRSPVDAHPEIEPAHGCWAGRGVPCIVDSRRRVIDGTPNRAGGRLGT